MAPPIAKSEEEQREEMKRLVDRLKVLQAKEEINVKKFTSGGGANPYAIGHPLIPPLPTPTCIHAHTHAHIHAPSPRKQGADEHENQDVPPDHCDRDGRMVHREENSSLVSRLLFWYVRREAGHTQTHLRSRTFPVVGGMAVAGPLPSF
jgi:hypothetical protein